MTPESKRAPAGTFPLLECVVNVSEGRDSAIVAAIAEAGGDCLLDVHTDADHHRSVLTLAGPAPLLEDAVREVARVTVTRIDLRRHSGVHPRLGALDVVPFVPLGPDGSPAGPGSDLTSAIQARNRFAAWAGGELGLPCFLYGPERTLPEVRRDAFGPLLPDTGPSVPHPGAGACAVGARPVLVAYNVWLTTPDVAVARTLAQSIRAPALRALGLAMAGATQVSCNLVDPFVVGPAQVYDEVRQLAEEAGTAVDRAELVGLVPAAVVDSIPTERWRVLDLGPDRTVESRLGTTRSS
jgi:glutamate formiminotransferase